MARRARKKAAALPLGLRLPNPPAVFVGRESDAGHLGSAIDRGPVSLVTGPGGVGKTALVLHTLHERFGRRVPRTLFLDVPPEQPAAQVRQEIVRALARAAGGEQPDLGELSTDPEGAIAVALDLAEAGPFWIVIDDIYGPDVVETNEMLVQLSSYARKSRWIATCRSSPTIAQLAGQIVQLAGLHDRDLRALAAQWAPQLDTEIVARAIASASGSPWLLHQLLLTGATEPELGPDGLLAGLSPEAVGFLRALAIVLIPLPLEVLSLFAPTPEAETLDALENRGLLHRTPAGYRLHDVARGLLLPANAPHSDLAARAAAALAEQELPDAFLEAARLFLALDRKEALVTLLDARGEQVFALGYAPRLWSIVRDVAEPALTRWKLRCAAELGNPTALSMVQAPRRRSAVEILAWARALHAQGDMAAAEAQCDSVLSAEDLDPLARAEAVLLRARCLRHDGRYEDAVQALAALTDLPTDLQTRRDAAIALCEVLVGGGDMRGLQKLRPQIRAGEPREAAHDLADALAVLGHLDEALELIEQLDTTAGASRAVLLTTRQTLLLSARTRLDRGELAAARGLSDEVRPYARGASLLRPQLHVADLTRRLVSGELDGLAPMVRSCAEEVRGIDNRCDCELEGLATLLDTVAAAEPKASKPVEHESRPSQVLALRRAIGRTRAHGELTAAPASPGDDRQLRILTDMLLATSALCAGDGAKATAHTESAVREADRWGLRTLEAEARELLLDAYLCTDRLREALEQAAVLNRMAAAMPSARYALVSELAERIATPARLDPASLEVLAGRENVSPVTARRAQALLAAQPALDHVDLRVLEAVAGHHADFVVEPVMPPPPAPEGAIRRFLPGWGLDERNERVWLPDGRTLELKGSLSWKILAVLAARGGLASKEALVRHAWGEAEYHPLRHDGRLHVAIRKLREALEDSPAEPTRILLADNGYQLGGIVRWRRR